MRRTYNLNVNGERKTVNVSADTPLLWVLRDHAGLTGTKFGCGVGQCGACTIHIDGMAQRSCVTPVDALSEDVQIETIEGVVARDPDNPVLDIWKALDVPQCGYCQTGQIMAALSFLKENKSPTKAEIRDGMTNYCRCCTYNKIAEAIDAAARAVAAESKN